MWLTSQCRDARLLPTQVCDDGKEKVIGTMRKDLETSKASKTQMRWYQCPQWDARERDAIQCFKTQQPKIGSMNNSCSVKGIGLQNRAPDKEGKSWLRLVNRVWRNAHSNAGMKSASWLSDCDRFFADHFFFGEPQPSSSSSLAPFACDLGDLALTRIVRRFAPA